MLDSRAQGRCEMYMLFVYVDGNQNVLIGQKPVNIQPFSVLLISTRGIITENRDKRTKKVKKKTCQTSRIYKNKSQLHEQHDLGACVQQAAIV